MYNSSEFEKEGDFRNNIVFILFKNHSKLLKYIKQNPRYTYSELRKLTGFSNGLVFNSIKDIKIMKLVTNGYGLTITPLGEEWLNDIENNGRINQDLIKRTCMNVPHFKKIYEENKELTEYKSLFNIFLELAPKNIDTRLIGSITKRYLEAFYNIKIRAGSKITRINKPKEKINLTKQYTKNNNLEIISAIKLVSEIKNLQEKYGKEAVKVAIENL